MISVSERIAAILTRARAEFAEVFPDSYIGEIGPKEAAERYSIKFEKMLHEDRIRKAREEDLIDSARASVLKCLDVEPK